jgi:hypothetical protein
VPAARTTMVAFKLPTPPLAPPLPPLAPARPAPPPEPAVATTPPLPAAPLVPAAAVLPPEVAPPAPAVWVLPAAPLEPPEAVPAAPLVGALPAAPPAEGAPPLLGKPPAAGAPALAAAPAMPPKLCELPPAPACSAPPLAEPPPEPPLPPTVSSPEHPTMNVAEIVRARDQRTVLFFTRAPILKGAPGEAPTCSLLQTDEQEAMSGWMAVCSPMHRGAIHHDLVNGCWALTRPGARSLSSTDGEFQSHWSARRMQRDKARRRAFF